MNKKHKHFKEWLKIYNEIDVLRDYRRNQNWIPLEKPYKSGYWTFYELRDDVKNRADAWVFEKCLELTSRANWCRDKSMTVKYKKGRIEHIFPERKHISKDVYENLHPTVKKHFAPIESWDKANWHPIYPRYYCTVPDHFFVQKVAPRWITHYQEVDSVIEQEYTEKSDYIYGHPKFRGVGKWSSGGSAPKSFTKFYNRSDRFFNKHVLKRNLSESGMDKYEYRYNHKNSATWDWW